MTTKRKGKKTKYRDYLYRQTQDNGKVYVYFRHPITRQLTRLPDDETSQEFKDLHATLKRAVEQADEPHPAKQKHEFGRWKNPRDYTIDPKIVFRPASIGWLIDRFKESDTWLNYSDGTRNNYVYAFNLLKKEIGTGLLHDMTPEHVDVYSARINRASGGAVADQQINLISNLWEFAKGFPEFKRKGRHCPTLGATRHYQHDGDGILAWPEEVFERFVEVAEPHMVAIVNGLRYTGQRGSDLVKMRWDDYDGKRINVIQQKTGERLWLTCPDSFRKFLDRLPRYGEFIFNGKWKRPYKHAGTLGTAVRVHVRRASGTKDYSMHGLRKNAGIELALAGCNVPEIMAVLGHKSPKMAIFYVKQVEKQTLGETAGAKWGTYIETKKVERVAKRRASIKPVK